MLCVPPSSLKHLEKNFEGRRRRCKKSSLTVAPSQNQKVLQYYTQLNGQRIQNITIDCTTNGPFFDYMSHRRQLRGSILSNLNVYQYNWFHCDDWCDFGPKYDQDNKGELMLDFLSLSHR